MADVGLAGKELAQNPPVPAATYHLVEITGVGAQQDIPHILEGWSFCQLFRCEERFHFVPAAAAFAETVFSQIVDLFAADACLQDLLVGSPATGAKERATDSAGVLPFLAALGADSPRPC
jgi:hypothetical protein